MTLVWVLSVFQVVNSIRNKSFPSSSLSLSHFSFYLLLLMFIAYFLFTHVRVILTRLPLLFIFLAFVFVLYAPGYAGRLALRILGIGGGVPISVTVKTILPGTQDIVATVKTGCLIVKSGSELMIKNVSNATPELCNPPIFAALGQENADRIQMFPEVEVLPIAQIVQINKWSVDKTQSK